MLTRKREGVFTSYYCSKCGKELALKDEDTGSGWIYSDCEHYCWANISKTCYYSNDERCEPEAIKKLKQESVLKIDRVDNVYLLIPKGGTT